MYRSEEWRARLWHLGPNEEALPSSAQQPSLSAHRTYRLKFCQDGIGLSSQWENRLKTIIARVEAVYQLWASLVEKLGWEDEEGARGVARGILGEMRWLRDQDGIAGQALRVVGRHWGVERLDFVVDEPSGGCVRGRSGGFTWVSFR